MSESDDDEPIHLNADTLAILKQFAVEQGAVIDDNHHKQDDKDDVLSSIHSFFALSKEDRKEIFKVDYTSDDQQVHVSFEVEGVKRELGQTLDSTGLTIWRAAEHMCEFIVNNRILFSNKSVCEVGAGLGMVSILLDKCYDHHNQLQTYISPPSCIITTDGDDDTISLLSSNIHHTSSSIIPYKLYCGDHDDFILHHPDLYDIIIGADIIYEHEQIIPLVSTVCKLLHHPYGIFYLAFARRNVAIDYVIQEFENHDMRMNVVDQNGMEPIYSFTWKEQSLS